MKACQNVGKPMWDAKLTFWILFGYDVPAGNPTYLLLVGLSQVFVCKSLFKRLQSGYFQDCCSTNCFNRYKSLYTGRADPAATSEIKAFTTWHHECVQPVHLPQANICGGYVGLR